MNQSKTFNVLAGLSILAAGWEIWTIINREKGDTFSATIKSLGKGQPFIKIPQGYRTGLSLRRN
jgi:hypothetical protein